LRPARGRAGSRCSLDEHVDCSGGPDACEHRPGRVVGHRGDPLPKDSPVARELRAHTPTRLSVHAGADLLSQSFLCTSSPDEGGTAGGGWGEPRTHTPAVGDPTDAQHRPRHPWRRRGLRVRMRRRSPRRDAPQSRLSRARSPRPAAASPRPRRLLPRPRGSGGSPTRGTPPLPRRASRSVHAALKSPALNRRRGRPFGKTPRVSRERAWQGRTLLC